ncbi:hypothetical protein [Pseudomonas cremoris]|nr:hypothetical protein [Pseudomonas cremoris]
MILHTVNGDVRTAYKPSEQALAIDVWRQYVKDGKRATLTIE